MQTPLSVLSDQGGDWRVTGEAIHSPPQSAEAADAKVGTLPAGIPQAAVFAPVVDRVCTT